MKKTLIITEKPSVGREYAEILGVGGSYDGYIENEQYIITWCVGHLITMSYPEKYDDSLKKWRLETLPFLPDKYRYEVNNQVAKQFNIVKTQLTRDDVALILWAGDPAREGQVIEEYIRMNVSIPSSVIEKRVWIDSTTEEEILRGIREARPMSDYDNLAQSGIMRAIEDYAAGINFSRALSVRYARLLNGACVLKEYHPIAVGRVMSCVLGMIVNREREIRNFKETVFYKPVAEMGNEFQIIADWKAKSESPELYKDIGFLDKSKAETFVKGLSGHNAIIKDTESKKEVKKAPLLFNLAELQSECTKQFKISPDETLQVAQSLYEKKLTTYPRTDARVLSSAIGKVIQKNIQGLSKVPEMVSFVDYIIQNQAYTGILKTKYVDDSKVSDHYAIIPTGETSGINDLSALEKDIYLLICKRFLSIFYPAAEYGRVKLTLSINNEQFISNTKALSKQGYLTVMGTEEQNDGLEYARKLAKLTKGTTLPVNQLSLKEGKTQPPRRYTSGSMILAMENAGQLIEEEELREQIKGAGIGTSATRAETIKKLTTNEHIKINKKTQVLTPTNFGEMIYEVLSRSIPDILNPKMTASWEKGLEQIANGVITLDIYKNKYDNYVKKVVDLIKSKDMTEDVKEAIKPFRNAAESKELDIICPKCKIHKMRLIPGKGYGCTGYKKDDPSSCSFFAGKVNKQMLTEAQFKELAEKRITQPITLTGPNGKYERQLVLSEDYKIEFLDEEEYVGPSTLPCPKCNKIMDNFTKSFRCKDKNCKCQVTHFIGNKNFTELEIRTLISNGYIDKVEFISPNTNNPYTARVEMTDKYKLQLVFDKKPSKPTDFDCPKCKKIKLGEQEWAYVCDNCGFKMNHTMAGLRFDNETVRILLKGETTPLLEGFKKKNGEPFDAKVKYNKRTKKLEFVKNKK